MKNSFDEIPNRLASESLKWHKYAPDVVPMWVADMDFRSPQPVIDALKKRAEHGIFGYPGDMPEFQQVIVDRMQSRYGWKIQPEAVIFLPGVVTGFNLACHALAQPGQGALIQTPVYPPFLSAPGNAHLIRQEMELTRDSDGRYSIDFDAFEAAITAETKVFILCNPHNPVGRVFKRNELERMAEICQRHGISIISDEIHCDLLFPGHRHTPIASLSPEVAANTITLLAPSKTFNIAGLECSIAIIPNPETRERFQKAGEGMSGWVNVMGLTAGLASYQHGQEWLDELLLYLDENRKTLSGFVSERLHGAQMTEMEGTYLAWINFNAMDLPGGPYQFFLERAKVAMNDGSTFGKGGEGFLRMNIGCPRSMLIEALERMEKALKSPVA